MNNHPLSNNYHPAFPFSPFGPDAGFGSGYDASVFKREVVQVSSHRTADREAAADPIVDQRVVSRYDNDVYGRPRILSRWEVILHALAWPVVIGMSIGYILVISLFVVHNFSTLKAPVKLEEAAS
jgi:hypothetical protein